MPRETPIGALLKRLRIESGWTHERLASEAGISPRTVSDIERGVRERPNQSTAERLADALRLTGDTRRTFFTIAAGGASDEGGDSRGSGDGDGAGAGQAKVLLPPFVGRADQVEEIARYLLEGHAPVLLLSGPPGIGTSRLVAQALERIRERELGADVVMVGGAVRDPVARYPYDPIESAIGAGARLIPRIHLRALLDGCEEVVTLLIMDQRLDVDPPQDTDPDRLSAAISRFLGQMMKPPRRGIALVLDNLQWAGDDALALLSALAASPDEGSPRHLRIVGVYDSVASEENEGFRRTIDTLKAAGQTREMQMHPLTREEAARLLGECASGGGAIDPAALERALERSKSIPLAVVWFGRALAAGLQARVPIDEWTVERIIRQRLFVADNAQAAVLDVLAVFAWPAPVGIIAAACGMAEGKVAGVANLLRDGGLLAEGSDEFYAFSHNTIRQVVMGTIGRYRRRILHRACADALHASRYPWMAYLEAYHEIEYAGLFNPPVGWVGDNALWVIELALTDAKLKGANAAARYYARAIEAGTLSPTGPAREDLGVAPPAESGPSAPQDEDAGR